MRWHSVGIFALEILFYGFDVLADLVKYSMVAWVSAITPEVCRLSVRFLIYSDVESFAIKVNGRKSRFIGTPSPHVRVNVYPYLTDSDTPHIAPLHRNQFSQKKS